MLERRSTISPDIFAGFLAFGELGFTSPLPLQSRHTFQNCILDSLANGFGHLLHLLCHISLHYHALNAELSDGIRLSI